LTESNLDLHNITVTLTGTTFRETLTKTEFTLLNAPAGLSIGSITRNSDTQCTLTLSYDGTDFDTDYTSFKIIVAGTQIPEGVNITSDALTITAVVETTPTVTISGASAITSSSATIGGNVTNSGGETVIEAGVVYSTISGTDPTIDGTGVTKVVGTGTSGEFTANLSNLSFSTTYYVRAYATNTLGTSYSSLISFNTLAVVPDAPTIGTATAGDAQASVSFTAPASNGGSSITGYTVTSNPGNLTGTGASSPIAVTGLTNGTAYTFTVTATNSVGTSQASAASNSVTPKTSQTITFANPGSQNFGTTPTLTATATSGLTPTFTSSTTGVCTITSDGVLTFLTSGTCTINADQAGSNSWSAAPTVTRSFTVVPVVPSAPTIGIATAGDAQASVTFTAPASTGGASITGYTVTSNPGGLTGTGTLSPITVTGLTNGTAYTFTVTATNSAGTGSASAASNSVTPKASQTITFANPGAQNFGTTPTLTATASSGLTPTFTSSTTGVCTITSDGTGSASAASNSVTPKASQTITFANPGAQTSEQHLL